MSARSSTRVTGFGFQPEQSQHHFLVTVPAGNRSDVLIAEHLTHDPKAGPEPPTLAIGSHNAKLRVRLPRSKWNAVADEVRVEFNRRLKRQGLPTGNWKTGNNAVMRLLGKELTLLAWAVEDADPALTPTAIRNWLGLAPEERWWLYTMTSAATGDAIQGRGKGWRKAVRFALTENPVGIRTELPTSEFRLVPTEARREEATGPWTSARRTSTNAGGK